jgi:hypothetical protein
MRNAANLILSIAGVGMFSCYAVPARAQAFPSYHRQIPYDPASCPEDAHGMVYIAIGRHVLRQPRANLIHITGGSPAYSAALPKPPDPKEPEGCPRHPIQGAAFTLGRISAMPDEAPTAASRYADNIAVIINDGAAPAAENGAFAAMCKAFQIPIMSVPGIIGCRKPFKCDQDVAFEAKDYSGSDGVEVAMFCRVVPDCSDKLAACDGGYRLHSDFTVNFRFGVASLPIAQFIEADRELRRRLGAAEVKDFEWR